LIRHRISLAGVRRRVLGVEVTFEPAVTGDGRTLDVMFPVWTPGSYLIREHPRHINDFVARQDGKPVPVEKIAKNVFRVSLSGTAALVLTYEVYANELTVRTSHVDSSHAFLNPVGFLPFVKGRETETQHVEIVDLPGGWDVACALSSRRDNGRLLLRAADYDELIDSPLECGPHAAPAMRASFEVRGVPHEIVFWGRSTLDRPQFAADVARIVEAQAAFFNGLPYERYLFFALASDNARGGLEHRASSALLYTRSSLARTTGYEDLLGLVSHELFHAWMVKRVRPAAFTPHDLTRENHTRLLWAFEGLTSYYEDIFLVRTRLMSRSRFLDLLAERLTVLERTPGRRRMSVSDASFDAWIRYYRQDENTDNSTVSYYLKGSLIGVVLDLAIRRATQGQKSLDDVMRLLWDEYGGSGRGVPEEGVEEACIRVGGESIRPLLHQVLRTTEDLPIAESLRALGLRGELRAAVNADDRGGPPPPGRALRCEIGALLRTDGDRVRVASVRRGTPADEAGLSPNDELVAIDGVRADAASAYTRLHDHAPGDSITLTLFRRDDLITLRLVAGKPAIDTWTITESPEATPDQRAALAAWLGG
jgi:predicted metalloprotease with PDZ domain